MMTLSANQAKGIIAKTIGEFRLCPYLIDGSSTVTSKVLLKTVMDASNPDVVPAGVLWIRFREAVLGCPNPTRRALLSDVWLNFAGRVDNPVWMGLSIQQIVNILCAVIHIHDPPTAAAITQLESAIDLDALPDAWLPPALAIQPAPAVVALPVVQALAPAAPIIAPVVTDVANMPIPAAEAAVAQAIPLPPVLGLPDLPVGHVGVTAVVFGLGQGVAPPVVFPVPPMPVVPTTLIIQPQFPPAPGGAPAAAAGQAFAGAVATRGRFDKPAKRLYTFPCLVPKCKLNFHSRIERDAHGRCCPLRFAEKKTPVPILSPDIIQFPMFEDAGYDMEFVDPANSPQSEPDIGLPFPESWRLHINSSLPPTESLSGADLTKIQALLLARIASLKMPPFPPDLVLDDWFPASFINAVLHAVLVWAPSISLKDSSPTTALLLNHLRKSTSAASFFDRIPSELENLTVREIKAIRTAADVEMPSIDIGFGVSMVFRCPQLFQVVGQWCKQLGPYAVAVRRSPLGSFGRSALGGYTSANNSLHPVLAWVDGKTFDMNRAELLRVNITLTSFSHAELQQREKWLPLFSVSVQGLHGARAVVVTQRLLFATHIAVLALISRDFPLSSRVLWNPDRKTHLAALRIGWSCRLCDAPGRSPLVNPSSDVFSADVRAWNVMQESPYTLVFNVIGAQFRSCVMHDLDGVGKRLLIHLRTLLPPRVRGSCGEALAGMPSCKHMRLGRLFDSPTFSMRMTRRLHAIQHIVFIILPLLKEPVVQHFTACFLGMTVIGSVAGCSPDRFRSVAAAFRDATFRLAIEARPVFDAILAFRVGVRAHAAAEVGSVGGETDEDEESENDENDDADDDSCSDGDTFVGEPQIPSLPEWTYAHGGLESAASGLLPADAVTCPKPHELLWHWDCEAFGMPSEASTSTPEALFSVTASHTHRRGGSAVSRVRAADHRESVMSISYTVDGAARTAETQSPVPGLGKFSNPRRLLQSVSFDLKSHVNVGKSVRISSGAILKAGWLLWNDTMCFRVRRLISDLSRPHECLVEAVRMIQCRSACEVTLLPPAFAGPTIKCFHALLRAGVFIAREAAPSETQLLSASQLTSEWNAAPAAMSAVAGAFLSGPGSDDRFLSRFQKGSWTLPASVSRPPPKKRFKGYDPVGPEFCDRMRESSARRFVEAEPKNGEEPLQLSIKDSDDQPWLRGYQWSQVRDLFDGSWRNSGETSRSIKFAPSSKGSVPLKITWMFEDDDDYGIEDVQWCPLEGALRFRLATSRSVDTKLTFLEDGFIRNESSFSLKTIRTDAMKIDYLYRENSPLPTELLLRFPTSRWVNIGPISMSLQTSIYLVSPVCSSQQHAALLHPFGVRLLHLTRQTILGFTSFIRNLGAEFSDWLRFFASDDDRIFFVVNDDAELPIAVALPQTASRYVPVIKCRDRTAVAPILSELHHLLEPSALDSPFDWKYPNVQNSLSSPLPFSILEASAVFDGPASWHSSLLSQNGEDLPEATNDERCARWGADEELRKRKGPEYLKRTFAVYYHVEGPKRWKDRTDVGHTSTSTDLDS
jgi:hypothetical protein